MTTELSKQIQHAMDSTEPRTKARNKALAAVRWVLKSDEGYLFTDGIRSGLVTNVSEATTYDGRDNEELKRNFFETVFGRSFTVEIIS